MLRAVSRTVARRLLHRSRVVCEASVFRMPAMSPTMEMGGIVEWKVKEGDTFNSGDQLLDVETDKATISVDAIDDGIMAKILLQDGAKDIPVGTPIAVTAEPGDDLSALELPDLNEAEQAAAPEPAKKEENSATDAKKDTSDVKPLAQTGKADPKQTLFPSVDLLLHENGISKEDALEKITATGPNGRILKGDVLAYLGKISVEDNLKIASFIAGHGHLDLSNIELRKPEESSPASAADSEKNGAKVVKKEPVVVSKEFVFNKDSKILSKLIRDAERAAYSISEVKSDLTDPLFEAIITPSRSVDRFVIDYTLDKQTSTLAINLTLNEKAFDANEKAQIFITSLETSLLN